MCDSTREVQYIPNNGSMCEINVCLYFCHFLSRVLMCTQIGQVQALAWSSGLNVYNLYGSCAGGVDRTMVSKSNITGTSVVSANFGWNFPWLPRVQKEREVSCFLFVEIVKSL